MRFLQQIQYPQYIKISVNSSNISDKVGKPSVSVCEIKSCKSWSIWKKEKIPSHLWNTFSQLKILELDWICIAYAFDISHCSYSGRRMIVSLDAAIIRSWEAILFSKSYTAIYRLVMGCLYCSSVIVSSKS